MRAVRIILVVAGVLAVGYGAVLLWDNSFTVLRRIVVWALVGVVVHDFVFAPLCGALGIAGRRLLPARWQSPVAVAAFCSVVLVLLAIPVYNKPGMRLSNPTVLDRDCWGCGYRWPSCGPVCRCTTS